MEVSMQAKWEVLCAKMVDAGVRSLGQIRLTPRGLSSRYYAKRAAILETPHVIGNREVLAYCGLWRAESEYQVGPLYLAPHINTPHMGRQVLREAMSLLPLGSRAFTILDQRCDVYDTQVVEEAVRRTLEEMGCCRLQVLLGRPH